MVKRNRIGALLAAGALVMGVAAVTFAAGGPPTYFIEVTKTADPASVPSTGGTVEFSVWVDNTGTGQFAAVVVDDGMAGCTMVLASGDGDADLKLDSNETWQYTCTVNDVEPDDTNTATVNACHDAGGACGGTTHDAQDTDSVTLGDCECTTPPSSQPPSSDPGSQDPGSQDPGSQDPGSQDPGSQDPGSADPGSQVPGSQEPDGTSDQAGDTDDPGATQAETDTLGEASARPVSSAWMLVVALGLLLASVLVMSPERASRKR